MSIIVNVIGLLKQYTKGQSIFEIQEGGSIQEIIQHLKIPNELVAGVFVNNQAKSKNYVPIDGETVKLIAVIGGG
jgi:sulfur carrier protein ThiS